MEKTRLELLIYCYQEYKNKYSDSRVHFNIEIKQKLC